eukprot:scaffold4898_cov152-Ochromonas_danica.AAC.3
MAGAALALDGRRDGRNANALAQKLMMTERKSKLSYLQQQPSLFLKCPSCTASLLEEEEQKENSELLSYATTVALRGCRQGKLTSPAGVRGGCCWGCKSKSVCLVVY